MFLQPLAGFMRFCDRGIAKISDRLALNSSSLIIFAFHGLFTSASEINSGVLDPQQGITVEMFRKFIADFQAHGYKFVTPRQILDGLEAGSKCALITFDDGYYNNFRALPLLEEFHVPAVFCVSTDHVKNGKSFWWDTLYREARNRQWPQARIKNILTTGKLKRTSEIEETLAGEFGKNALCPVSDLDRPMTPAELSKLASHPLCCIGNHTVDHAILTNYTAAEAKQQIVGAQQFLQQQTGSVPDMIAYPNGNVSPEIIQVTRETGLKLGVTVQPGKNRADIGNYRKALALKRFTLWGNHQVETQCQIARSAFSLTSAVAGLRVKSRPALT
jgi:peptidoglycan/xylan/chitin deacetylase (PgdA/CDA1 family)